MPFSDATKNAARLRQWGLCGRCGHNLDHLWEEAHHIRPQALGGSDDVDNCVVLCDKCNQAAHNFGNFRSLIVAPRDYFPFFNGRGR